MSTALSLMKNGKSSGLDGIPFEWYKKFWNIIGHDLHDVFFFGGGGDDAIAKNLTLMEENVSSFIKRLTFFSKGVPVSFIGRVLVVVNSLCASKLWYIISVLQPPQNNKGIH